ncbi:MAG: hypothetical protein LH630_03245 [Actinomycetia bacterium]|nr:hypothetical protein [Actinomycetes bacterium]
MKVGHLRKLVTAGVLVAVAALLAGCLATSDGPDPVALPSSMAEPTATVIPQALPGAPGEFISVIHRGLGRFDASTGAMLQHLTSPPQGFRDHSPVLAGDRVVFVRQSREHQCDVSIQWVAADAARHTGVLIDGGLGYIDAMTVSVDGSTVALSYSSCQSDLPPKIKVLDVVSGEVTLEISNPAGGNGSLGANTLMLIRGRLVVFVGIHLTTWLASVDLSDPEATQLSEMPRLPFPDRCRLLNAVAQGESSIVGITSCGKVWRLYHLTGPDLNRFRLGSEVDGDGNYPMLTGATGDGYLIGTTRIDHRDAILQIHNDQQRILPMCTNDKQSPDQWCSYVPIWAHHSTPEPPSPAAQVSFGGSAKESRARAVQAFVDEGGALCAPEDLRNRFGMDGGAGGWIIGGISIVNTTHTACALFGPIRFVGLDSHSRPVTKVSICDDMVLKHSSCAAPIVLYPIGTAEPRHHPNAISVRLYGWGRGGVDDSGCPARRVVEPATLRLTLGQTTLAMPNHDPRWQPSKTAHIWGCGGVGIATGPKN